MQLSCIYMLNLVYNLFYYATSRWDTEWINIDEQGKKRWYMLSLHLGQDLGGTTVESNGWLRASSTHQNIRDLLVGFPLILDRCHALCCSPKAMKKLFGGNHLIHSMKRKVTLQLYRKWPWKQMFRDGYSFSSPNNHKVMGPKLGEGLSSCEGSCL